MMKLTSIYWDLIRFLAALGVFVEHVRTDNASFRYMHQPTLERIWQNAVEMDWNQLRGSSYF